MNVMYQEKKARPARAPRIRCPFFYQQRRARLDYDLILLSLMNSYGEYDDDNDDDDIDDEDVDDSDARELYLMPDEWEVDSDLDNHTW